MKSVRLCSITCLVFILLSPAACQTREGAPGTPGPAASSPRAWTEHPALPLRPPQEIEGLGDGSAEDIAWTPDGKQPAAGGSASLPFFDGGTGRLVRHLGIPADPSIGYPTSISLGRDGHNLLFVGLGGVRETILEDGQTAETLEIVIYSRIRALYNLDGTKLACPGQASSADGLWNGLLQFVEIP